MKQIYLVSGISVGVTFFGNLFGGLIGMIITLLIITFLELLTSIINLAIKKKLTALYCLKRLIKCLYILIFVLLSGLLDKYLLSGTNDLCLSVVMFYICIELLIIINNASNMGVPIPKKLRDALNLLMK